MVVVVAADQADAAIAQLTKAGEDVHRIGRIRERAGEEHQTIVL
jgi:phosphoribosylformylglycinamidine cyclo-ligase